MQYGAPPSRSFASATIFLSRMAPGLSRMIGMSAAPTSFFFFSSLHCGRDTPALEHSTTLGAMPLALPLSKALANSVTPSMSMSVPSGLKPDAHQMTASAPSHMRLIAAAQSSLARSQKTSSMRPSLGRTSNAFAPSRTTARTVVAVPSLCNRRCTTRRPTRPVAPVTTTVGGARALISAVVSTSAAIVTK